MEQKIINCSHCSKIIPEIIIKGDSARKVVTCPDCGSQRNCKDGMRQGKFQRYLYLECGRRFSERPTKT
jgi:DNA-directed RNA polymerase subunit RPC12/RpoP